MRSAVNSALADDLRTALAAPDSALARAALVIARIEYPRLDPEPCLARLDELGREAALRMDGGAPAARIARLNELLFEQEAFGGNHERYDDPGNSCLNSVLDRRTGIPITLSVVYMEVAQRAGLQVDGVNFPGHFLVRCAADPAGAIIIDPFHAGAVLSEQDCRRLLGTEAGESTFDRALLAPTTLTQIATRMLTNLKRLYVEMRSFPQARVATELLLTLNPASLTELRDRGLLAYHLNDLPTALRDLQTYLSLAGRGVADEETRDEQAKVWEHIKALRRRTATLN